MLITFHAGQRMNRRGIEKKMIELVLEYGLEYGEVQDEKTTLSRDAAARLVAELRKQMLRLQQQIKDAAARLVAELRKQMLRLQQQIKTAKKVLDKGGLTVVSDESRTLIITTYNCFPLKKKRKKSQFHVRNSVEQTFGFQRRKHDKQ